MMSSAPFVSVIIPVYNESGFIGSCIEGFQNQSYPAELMEFLVVDGMSNDGCRDEVAALQESDPRIRLIDNPRRVAAAAANEGIAHARGDILCFLSAHGEPDPDYVATSVRLLEETGAGGIGGRYLHVGLDPVSKAIGLAMSSPFGMASPHRSAGDLDIDTDTISHPTFRREVFDTVGGYDEELLSNEDYELNYRVRRAGYKLIFSPEISSVYRPRSSLRSLSKQFYAYGTGKAAVMKRHPGSVRPRHLVPPLAALGLASTPLLLLARPGRVAVLVGAISYGAVIGAAVAKAKPWRHGADVATFVVSLPVMHSMWGAGLLSGLTHKTRTRSGRAR
jgi:succinoglycan biosynthesis protein ExoA